MHKFKLAVILLFDKSSILGHLVRVLSLLFYFSLSEKSGEIDKLKTELQNTKAELSSLGEQLDAQKKKNNVCT